MEEKNKAGDVVDPTMEEIKEVSKRPDDAPWKQQRLPAWQPLLTPKWVIAIFTAIAVVFIPLGIALLVLSYNVVEVRQRYDDMCGSPGVNVSYCTFNMSITSTMSKPVYVYYELSNFFQNHRRYVKSRSDTQLSGQGLGSSLSACDPVEYYTDSTGTSSVIVPCGLIANSFFNDTFSASYCTSGACTALAPSAGQSVDDYPGWKKTGIAWSSDVSTKFVYQPLTSGYTNMSIEGFALPQVNDEDFIVWMRTAGLPTFRKLYRVITDRDLVAGSTLTITVKNVYPVSVFSGSKAVVLSTTSVFGGRNLFLGWAYIAVGALALLLAFVFLIKQVTSPRRLGDMQYFHWPSQSKDLDTNEE